MHTKHVTVMDLTAILFAAAGLVCSAAMVWILNKMPARCFCDYDETPDEQHNPPRVSRLSFILCGIALAIVFALLSMQFGVSIKSCFLCLFCTCLMMILLSDARYSIIPDELVIAGCIFAVISVLPGVLSGNGWLDCLSPVLGAAIGGGIILAINFLGQIFYKKDALGMGDLKLMIVCGIACGTAGTVIALLVGILAAGIWFSAAILLKRVNGEDYMPLGPFLVFGAVFTLCLRPLVDELLSWYISLII